MKRASHAEFCRTWSPGKTARDFDPDADKEESR